MTTFKFVVYQEGKYFVSQCLNMEVASFGETIDEAVANLKDAVSLYLKDDSGHEHGGYRPIGSAMIGEAAVNA
jgi:predicted RNase H-like HicB family nuclease